MMSLALGVAILQSGMLETLIWDTAVKVDILWSKQNSLFENPNSFNFLSRCNNLKGTIEGNISGVEGSTCYFYTIDISERIVQKFQTLSNLYILCKTTSPFLTHYSVRFVQNTHFPRNPTCWTFETNRTKKFRGTRTYRCQLK